MKLSLRGATFCPGCPKKELKLNNVPKLIITPENSETIQKMTILTKSKKTNLVSGSLF